MNKRTALLRFLQRHEARNPQKADFAAWEGEQGDLNKRLAAGELHLDEAVLEARAALASGNKRRIAKAVDLCKDFEIEGLNLAVKLEGFQSHANDLAAQDAANQLAASKDAAMLARQKGGKKKAKAVADAWDPWVREFEDRVGTGRPPKTPESARISIWQSMSEKSPKHPLPGGRRPSYRTVQRRFRTPRKKTPPPA
jgi:hypothetical protein